MDDIINPKDYPNMTQREVEERVRAIRAHFERFGFRPDIAGEHDFRLAFKATFDFCIKPKGICLVGGPGSGKTKLMDLVKASIPSSRKFNLFDAQDCEWLVDHDTFDMWMEKTALFLDDVGTERDANNYGVRSNVFADFIGRHYERMATGRHVARLFMTTNLAGDELISKYGARVFSRMKELFAFVKFEGGDHREMVVLK